MRHIKISVLTLTYLRHEILEESIKSYLSQDFKGDSEMVIINDADSVEYIYNHPRIRIINCKERFPSIAAKINFGYKQCKYDYIYRLDDDDLLTSFALSLTNQNIIENPGYDIYRSKSHYFFSNNEYIQLSDNINNGNVFTREYLNRIVFPDKSGNEDVDIVFGNNAKISTSSKDINTMIYRWGMKTYHISGMGEKTNDEILNWTDNIVSGVQQGFSEKQKEEGVIILNPHFDNDYYSQIKISFESKIITDILNKHNINGIEIGGTDKNTWHTYTSTYENILKPYLNKQIKLLEIGVENGASALLWQEFLPLSYLYLVDIQDIIKTKNKLDSSRYTFYKMDAYLNDKKIKEDNPEGFDIIIDDGPHTIDSQILCIKKYLPFLRKDGLLIIEDIQNISYIDILKKLIPNGYHSECIDLRFVKNRYDDILFIIKYDGVTINESYDPIQEDIINLTASEKTTLVEDDQKKIKFIIPLPDSSYYLWQILVQINNFRKLGYEIDTHYPVCYFNNKPSDTLIALSNSENINATFHLYADTRENKTYSASMKPWLMSQYFKEFPEEKDNIYIYLDPDVIFFAPLKIDDYLDDNIWYESDTCSYLDSKYIKSKGDQLFIEMCEIVGISPDTVINNDKNAGGAQYITKNNTFEYWDEVEKTSHPLYKHMIDTASKYKPKKEQYPIQAWTSEMWTTNWCLWKRGISTKCIHELDFHWANHKMVDLTHNIYHNAGVTNNDSIHFAKTAYQKSPFNVETKGSIDSLSYKYIEEIKNTEMNFPELITCF